MTQSPVTIHRVGADTLSLLDRVADDVFDHPIAPRWLAAFVAAPTHFLSVALADGIVVGQIAAQIHYHPDCAPDLFIENLGVAPRRQRRGIARHLVEAALAWGRAQGCTEAWVLTEPDNAAAGALYGALGGRRTAPVLFSYNL